MKTQYILFYISVGLFLAAVLNLFIILSIRIKGETIFYKLDPKSPDYEQTKNKYQKRASTKYLLITILAIVLVALITFLQALTIVHSHTQGALSTLGIGSAILLFLFFVLIYKAVSTFGQSTSHDGNH